MSLQSYLDLGSLNVVLIILAENSLLLSPRLGAVCTSFVQTDRAAGMGDAWGSWHPMKVRSNI